LKDGGVVDGHGTAAFINHSCDPNCETDEIDGHIWIIAARNIAAGEELTYDYNLFDGDFDAPCHCGAKSCRGSMYDPAVLRQKRREERKKIAKRKRACSAHLSSRSRPSYCCCHTSKPTMEGLVVARHDREFCRGHAQTSPRLAAP
jgi:hypothetical protein